MPGGATFYRRKEVLEHVRVLWASDAKAEGADPGNSTSGGHSRQASPNGRDSKQSHGVERPVNFHGSRAIARYRAWEGEP